MIDPVKYAEYSENLILQNTILRERNNKLSKELETTRDEFREWMKYPLQLKIDALQSEVERLRGAGERQRMEFKTALYPTG